MPRDGSASGTAASIRTEEARGFLQERLALLGRAYGLLVLCSCLAANLASSFKPGYRWSQLVTDLANQLALVASAVYLAQLWLCRKGARSVSTLRLIDGTSATLVAVCSALMVFATIPGEVPGVSYARSLLLMTFGLVMRAVVVPSTARFTLLLGLVAVCFPVATSQYWFESQGFGGGSPVYTALWCLAAVAIATLASHAIFGLRQQVSEARQLGQYTLLEKIGEGGMGAVYRASHAMLRRPTAIKLLPRERAGTEYLERFEREVQLTSRLSHPNTVAIFDYGRTPDGVFYYAMEYLEGLNLEDLVRLDGRQPPARVVHVLRQVAGSLAEAHGAGLIHRDIKPANVILVAEHGGAPDVVKVVDFGLVKDLDQAVERSRTDLVAGTPHYLSPEAIVTPERVDARSDLYALGCVGYYLLTGERVFEGHNVVEVCNHHLHTPPLPPAERLGEPLPERLSRLLLCCLAKKRESRPASATAFLAALDACVDVPAWTNEEARAWWSTQGARIVALVRGKAMGVNRRDDRSLFATAGAATPSFVRRADEPLP